MKKLTLAAIAMYACILASFSQEAPKDTVYKNRKLRVEEVNLVSSYYHQDGNNSAVTGGIGTEKLTDFSNIIELKLARHDRKGLKHDLGIELGFSTYTSASSDMIDPKTISSASTNDRRIYPSVSYNISNENTGNGVGLNVSASSEYDYQSFGFGLGITRSSKDRNREFTARVDAYLDKVQLIIPIEFRDLWDPKATTLPRKTYSTSFVLSQVVNPKFQLALLADIVYQEGLLSTPFHRVYFTDGTHDIEALPESRFKIPLAIRANYFAGDKTIFRSYYRYYHDDWGLDAHTAELETVLKVSPAFSVSPSYRFYRQSGVRYFAPFGQHESIDAYYTSDYDLSTFSSHAIGLGLRLVPPGGIFGWLHWNMIELKYQYYNRSTGLNANLVSFNARFQ